MQWIHAKLYNWLFLHFRRSRMKWFFDTFSVLPQTHVLDVGGTSQTWTHEAQETAAFHVTLLNIRDYGIDEDRRFTNLLGDATQMPFANDAFDIVFSNSVIEHVTTWEKQQAFAHEVRRVGQRLWIQTPARSFPIEAHLWAPWIQYLPKTLQHRFAPWTLRGILQPSVAHEIVDEVRLLTYREMEELFPDCVILRERVLGLTKSYIAVRHHGAGDWNVLTGTHKQAGDSQSVHC